MRAYPCAQHSFDIKAPAASLTRAHQVEGDDEQNLGLDIEHALVQLQQVARCGNGVNTKQAHKSASSVLAMAGHKVDDHGVQCWDGCTRRV